MNSAWRIRSALELDALGLLAYFRELTAVPPEENNVLLDAGEFNLTLEQEIAFIRKAHEETNSTLLVAEATTSQPRVVAVAGCHGRQTMINRHVGLIGLSVAKAWRGQGIGRALMKTLLEFARTNAELQRLELSVFDRNQPAIRLYESLGFTLEGRRPKALRRGGVYMDELEMGLWLEPAGPSENYES